jgi:hypothetical protein
MKLTLTHFSLRRFLRQIMNDPQTWTGSFWRFIPFWLKGYSTEQVVLFEMTKQTMRDYPPDALRYRITTQTNRHVWTILHDKLFFDSFMRGRLPVIEAAFFVILGKLHSMPESSWDVARFQSDLEAGNQWVLKSSHGGGGVGILFVKRADEGFTVNGKIHDWSELRVFLSGLEYHVAYPFVEPHPVLRSYFPDTVNTLRLTVYRDDEGVARLFNPVLRVGCRASVPVDNFQQGGLTVAIDEENGVCTRAFLRGSDGRRLEVTQHPESGAPLLGGEIPFWNEIRETLLTFHREHPAFDLVGWDVLVGRDAFWIIEGNHNPGMRMVFLFGHLGQRPELRAFFEKRVILP